MPLADVRVVEVGQWLMVPMAAAILADQGADVIKVEPPAGDATRSLRSMGIVAGSVGHDPFHASSPVTEIANRGARSIMLDALSPGGREVLERLVRTADVFLTNCLPSVQQRLGIDPVTLQSVNPRLIVGRGSGWGPSGPMRDMPGFDTSSAWAAGGVSHTMTRSDGEPPPFPPGLFDIQAGLALAGAVGTALFHRERTGRGTVIDVSLLSTAWFAGQLDISTAPYSDAVAFKASDRRTTLNPLTNCYCTSDGRWIFLVAVKNSDQEWSSICEVLRRAELITDTRFADRQSRIAHAREAIDELDRSFAQRPFSFWITELERFAGAWAPQLTPLEVNEHVQAQPNGYIRKLESRGGDANAHHRKRAGGRGYRRAGADASCWHRQGDLL